MKNSFRGVSARNFLRVLLNVGWAETPKCSKITAVIPFSTATPDNNSWRYLWLWYGFSICTLNTFDTARLPTFYPDHSSPYETETRRERRRALLR
jgi:hypothetical protein